MYRPQLRVPRNFLTAGGVEMPMKMETLEPVSEVGTPSTVVPLAATPSFQFLTSAFDYMADYDRLRKFTLVTAVFHFVQACILLGLWVDIKATKTSSLTSRVDRVAVCWDRNMHITNHIDDHDLSGYDRIDAIAWLIIIFFFLSAILQVYAVYYTEHMSNMDNNKPQWVRYFEYSISASCMMIAIAISFGLLDVYLHLCIFMLTFVCMVMGLVADVIRDIAAVSSEYNERLADLMMKVHYISWIPMIVPWIILLAVAIDLQQGSFRELCQIGSLVSTNDDIDDREMPWFVWVVLGLEFALFSVFGYVQRWQFYQEYEMKSGWVVGKQDGYNKQKTGLRTELYFVCLSLSAKSILGWVIYSQVIVRSPELAEVLQA
jgi:hypothetical protein